jgi:hypothetical protein
MPRLFAMASTWGELNAPNTFWFMSSPKETPTTLPHGERRVGMIGENVV